MLKKLALIGVLSLSLVGCSNTTKENNSESSNDKTSITENSQKKSKKQDSKLEYVSSEVEPSSSGYIKSRFVIKNNTNDTINTISLTINELDKEGNIANTIYPQEPTKVRPGQTITIKAIDKEGKISSLELVNFNYYNSNEEFIEGDFPEGIVVKVN
ncbi:FxLYD domain-containing protein [Paraclostridium sordellii]|uniref:FxLYD domain-containing protein n=1 Tax=Paraclostridium sordellii TaxID=1505 RepID=UPI0005EA4644|nr:FxLYD domain-containing protein [Paeniclostridium sordellii]CEN23757.1 Uncharacterised protein [[Clostridium] sordellii] [Paeniclostridium sordellii]